MLNTSLDLFYIVLALCIVWITIFLCYLMYHAGRVLRNANKIVESLMDKLELISQAVNFIQQKVDGLSGHMGKVSGMVAGLVEKMIMNKLEKTASSKKPTAKKKTKLDLREVDWA